ncbi:MAG: GDSL family lipase, partial [Clostridia bacterium]|nr:GDSL family lipase [Clostridia bacterium]
MKIVFQGDSITDAGRDKRNYHQLGAGYPKFAAEYISESFPDADIEFINLGISGNRTDQLFD